MKPILRSLAFVFVFVTLLSFGQTGGALGASAPNPVASGLVAPAARDYISTSLVSSRHVLTAAFYRPGDSLSASSTSTHFKVHYDPTLNSAEDVSALLGNLEQAYAELVLGGGGTSNAGLKPPVSDGSGGGDNKVDFYLTASSTQCGSGAVGCSITAGYSGYVEIMAQYATGSYSGAAGTAAHEFTHLIEASYGRTPLMETSADWGEFWVFPNAPNHFATTSGWSLDCHNTTEMLCAYVHFPFIERQVETYGVGFVNALFVQGPVDDLTGLRDAIALASSSRDTLSGRYASYARELWNPAVWSEPMRDRLSSWLAYTADNLSTSVEINRSMLDSGEQTTNVDQMAAGYVRISTGSSIVSTGDQLRISVLDPSSPGISTPTSVLVGNPNGQRSEVALSDTCGTFRCVTIPYDSASVSDVVIPLVNDNDPLIGDPVDGLPFTWRAELLPAPEPDLTVSLARKTSRRLGNLYTTSFVVTLRNSGLATDGRVRATIALPVGAGFKGISFRGRKCSRKGRQAICSVETLLPQKTVRLSFVAKATKRAKVRVSVSGNQIETSLANNTARRSIW
jgi:Domain of unknown function DUF11